MDLFKILPGDTAVNQGTAGENKLGLFKKMEIRRLDPDSLCSKRRVKLSGWHHVGSQAEGEELL